MVGTFFEEQGKGLKNNEKTGEGGRGGYIVFLPPKESKYLLNR